MANIIEYHGVEVLRNEHVALKDVDWTVAEGSSCISSAPWAPGKTSLLKTVYAEVPVTVGTARDGL